MIGTTLHNGYRPDTDLGREGIGVVWYAHIISLEILTACAARAN